MPEIIPSQTGSGPPTTQVELEFALGSAVREPALSGPLRAWLVFCKDFHRT